MWKACLYLSNPHPILRSIFKWNKTGMTAALVALTKLKNSVNPNCIKYIYRFFVSVEVRWQCSGSPWYYISYLVAVDWGRSWYECVFKKSKINTIHFFWWVFSKEVQQRNKHKWVFETKYIRVFLLSESTKDLLRETQILTLDKGYLINVCILEIKKPVSAVDVGTYWTTGEYEQAGCDIRSIFKWSKTGSNWELLFSLTGCLTKSKETSLTYYSPIAGDWEKHMDSRH